MTAHPHFAALDRLKTRIQGLRSKTTDNGCTEAEALLAAAKVAELLDRYDLSLTDVEIRDARCERREYETYRKKRIPLDDCVGAIANFCDCRVWRENEPGRRGSLRILRPSLRYRGRALPDRADRQRRAVRARPLQEFGGLEFLTAWALSGLLSVQSDKRARSSSTFVISSWRRGFLASDVSAKSRIRYRASAAASAHVVDGAARACLSNSSWRRRRAAWSA